MTQQKDQSLWKLVHYFVSLKNYSFVQVQDIKDEVWLTNPEHPKYPIIRVSPSSINATFFEKDRIQVIYKAIAKHHKTDKKLLDIHTKVEEDEEYDDEFIQVSLNEKTTSIPDFLLNTFDDIKMAFTQDFNGKQKLKIDEAFSKTKRKKPSFFEMVPPMTLVFLALTIAVFTVLRLLTLRYEDPVAVSILLGSYYKIFVVTNYEFWRFLTAGFVHIDFFHILINSIALINLGTITEKIFGQVKFTIILLVSIVVGTVFVFVGQGNSVVVGSSGGLYGLMGALLVYTFESGMIKQPLVRSQFIRILLINLMISLLPSVSLLGHLGGFVAGVLLAIIFSQSKRWAAIRAHTKIAFIGLIALLVMMIAVDDNNRPYYLITDQRVIEYARDLNWDWYANNVENNLINYYGGNYFETP